jgi:3-oxoacyl-[acyl-carrier protein] reductase
MDLGLRGKVVLVTAGSHGLGKSICRGLAAEGADIAINYRKNEEIVRKLIKEIEKDHSVKAIGVCGDVSEEDDVVRIFNEAEKYLSPVNILVNNAAISPSSYVKDTELELWNNTFKTNTTGSFLTSRELIRRLLESKHKGKIINISTTSAYRGSTSGRAHYDASKGGVNSFTISLAKEVAKYGINVNAVASGLMITKMTRERFLANKEKYLATIPMGRYADTQEVADVVVFLASEKANYMTGTIVNVSGGLHMG